MNNENLIFYDDPIKDESVLGILEGPCADFIDSTRNNRHYSEELWENVFKSDLVRELIDNGGIPGELDHPEDREETCSERIAILLKEIPKKKDGKLWARFSILNTPLGRIAYTLAKAGFKYGISSRGSGDIIEGFTGREEVDPSTYEFKAFDLVLIPAVKDARLSLVTESLNHKFDYKKALLEQLNSSSEEERVLMKDTLNSLDINLDEELTYKGYKVTLGNSGVILSGKEGDQAFPSLDDAIAYADKSSIKEDLEEEKQLEDTSLKEDDNIEKEDDDEEADDDGSDLVIELQETLKRNAELEKVVKSLQERLSVCYAKEKKNEGQINTYRSSIKSLQESSKKAYSLETKVSSLEEELETSKKTIESKNEKLKKLNEQLDDIRSQHKDKIEVASSTIVDLNKEVDSLKEELQRVKSSKSTSIATLKESYSKKESDFNDKIVNLQKDSKLREKQLQEKLERANSEVERLKGIAQKAIDKYIVEKCTALGISPQDVKNRLGKSYSFNDINRICESLSNSKLAIDNLPFKSSRVSKIQVKESFEKPMIKNLDSSGDNIDAQLLSMVDRLT